MIAFDQMLIDSLLTYIVVQKEQYCNMHVKYVGKKNAYTTVARVYYSNKST
jgi:hypothetical protein